MAVQGKIVFEVEVDGSGAATGVKQINQELAKTGDATRRSLEPLREAKGGIVGTLNDLTGGLASKFLDVREALGGVTKGFGALRGAIIATGIGALIVAVGLLIENWDELRNMMNSASISAQNNLDIAEKQVTAEQSKLDSISAQENILKLQGKSEREILELKLAQTDEVIKAQEAQLLAQEQVKKEQIAAAERNKKILSGIIQFITAPLQGLLFTVDKIAEFVGAETNLRGQFNDFLSGLVFDPEEVAEENDKAIQETRDAIAKLKNDRAGLQLSINAIDKKAAEERSAMREKELAEEDKRRATILEKQRKFNEERLADEIKAADRKAAEEQKRKDDAIALEQAIADARMALFATEEEKERAAIQAKYDALFELAKDDSIRQSQLRSLLNSELLAIDKKTADEQKRIKEAQFQNDIELTKSGLDALVSLNEAFEGKSEQQRKAAFKRNKALKVAQTLITTYQNATQAYASQLTIPSPDAPARAAIAAGVAVAQGLAQVAAITKQQYSGEGGGGGGGSVGSPSFGGEAGQQTQVPFNPISGGAFGQQPQAQPIQAYVLTSSVTSAAHAQQKIEELSTL